jgi:hypothetical protein
MYIYIVRLKLNKIFYTQYDAEIQYYCRLLSWDCVFLLADTVISEDQAASSFRKRFGYMDKLQAESSWDPRKRDKERDPVFMTVIHSDDVFMIFMYWKIISNLRNCAISGACFTAPSVSRLYNIEWGNDELERIWKDAVVAQSRYNASICLEGPRKPGKPQSG